MPVEEMTYREGIKNTLDGMNERMKGFETQTGNSLDRIENQVRYTNGKLRKVVVALIFIGGVVIGQLFTNKEIISMFISAGIL